VLNDYERLVSDGWCRPSTVDDREPREPLDDEQQEWLELLTAEGAKDGLPIREDTDANLGFFFLVARLVTPDGGSYAGLGRGENNQWPEDWKKQLAAAQARIKLARERQQEA
jgi:hypothetical protein